MLKNQIALVAAFLLSPIATMAQAPLAQPPLVFTFTTIDFPDATSTEALGINDLGHIVGAYIDASGQYHGFLLVGETYTSIDYPGGLQTTAFDINDWGLIVGQWEDIYGAYHGYGRLLGFFGSFDPPDSTDTQVWGVNNKAQIVGWVYGSPYGFLLSKRAYSMIQDPNNTGSTIAEGINDAGHIVGTYTTNIRLGFLFDGVNYFDIQFPGSGFTDARGINNSGTIVGVYTEDNPNVDIGFLLNKSGYYSVSVPGPSGPYKTTPNRINNLGIIVGYYVDYAGVQHGFRAQRKL